MASMPPTGRMLEEFARRIEVAEREACANVCEEVANAPRTTKSGALAARECMGFIRMRSNAKVSGAGTASAGLPG